MRMDTLYLMFQVIRVFPKQLYIVLKRLVTSSISFVKYHSVHRFIEASRLFSIDSNTGCFGQLHSASKTLFDYAYIPHISQKVITTHFRITSFNFAQKIYSFILPTNEMSNFTIWILHLLFGFISNLGRDIISQKSCDKSIFSLQVH